MHINNLKKHVLFFLQIQFDIELPNLNQKPRLTLWDFLGEIPDVRTGVV